MTVPEADFTEALDSWVQFRNAYCKIHRMYAGRGTIAPMVNNNCLRTLTRRHIGDMERLNVNPVKGPESCRYPELTQSQSDNACAQDAAHETESRLSEVLDQARMTIGAGAGLENAHQQWILYRDSTCDLEGSFYQGGTIQPAIIANCIAALNTARMDYLTELSLRPRG